MLCQVQISRHNLAQGIDRRSHGRVMKKKIILRLWSLWVGDCRSVGRYATVLACVLLLSLFGLFFYVVFVVFFRGPFEINQKPTLMLQQQHPPQFQPFRFVCFREQQVGSRSTKLPYCNLYTHLIKPNDSSHTPPISVSF